MPSRWVCVAIIAFWLGINGWLLWKEVWPSLQPGQPPPFTIDLVEEVQFGAPPKTAWNVTVAGQEKETYHAHTWVEREPGGELYELHLEVSPVLQIQQGGVKPLSGGLVQNMTSRCRVTPAGHLRGLEAEVLVARKVLGVVREVKASFRGDIRGDRFFGHYDIGGVFKGDLDPVSVAHNGAVFLAFHPVQRYRNLRPGQTWRQPSLGLPFDLGGVRVNFVEARVLDTPPMLSWKGKETPCLVIEYEDDDQRMQTWVEKESGLVLRQDAVVGTEHWILQRDR
jgi:hypothetical protein